MKSCRISSSLGELVPPNFSSIPFYFADIKKQDQRYFCSWASLQGGLHSETCKHRKDRPETSTCSALRCLSLDQIMFQCLKSQEGSDSNQQRVLTDPNVDVCALSFTNPVKWTILCYLLWTSAKWQTRNINIFVQVWVYVVLYETCKT